MPWICEDCGKRFGWDYPADLKKCPSCGKDFIAVKVPFGYNGYMIRHIPWYPIEGKATTTELKDLAKNYSDRYGIPRDLCEKFFLRVCHTECNSGHERGMCIHNIECLNEMLKNDGFLMPLQEDTT